MLLFDMDINLIQHTAAINWFHYMHERDDPYLEHYFSRFQQTEQLLLTEAQKWGIKVTPVSLTHKHFYDNTPIWKIQYRDYSGEIQLQDCASLEYLLKKQPIDQALQNIMHKVIARKIAGKSTLQATKHTLKSHKKDVALKFFTQFNLFKYYETFHNIVSLCEQHPIIGDPIFSNRAATYWMGLRRFPLKEQLYLISHTHYNTTWRALPWDGLISARSAWRKEGLQSMGALQQWQHALGVSLNGYTFHNHFTPNGFKVKTWKFLIEKYKLALTKGPRKGYVDSGMGLPLINLIHLFDTPETIEKMCLSFNQYRMKQSCWEQDRSQNMPKLIHDLGDFTLYRNFTENEKIIINQWCREDPRIFKKLGSIQAFIMDGGQLKDAASFLVESEYRANTPLAFLCADVKMSKYEYQAYEHFWNTYIPKTYDVLPTTHCESERFILRKLEPSDLRGPMLGKYTSCCQHLHSTAKKTAIHGVISPYSAFYVLTDKNDNIMSQCYAWMNTQGDLIIDSIEGIFQTEDNRWNEVSQLWQQFIGELSQHCAIYLGKNEYGMTKDVWADIQETGIPTIEYQTTPFDTDSYFDGLTHYYLTGTPRNISPDQLPYLYGILTKETSYEHQQ